jgi:DNA topoisomerase-1
VTQKPVYLKTGRFGTYVQLGEAGGDEKPKTSSLVKSMTPETVTLDDALRLLSLPREIGKDEAGVPIIAHLGRFGSYLTRGTDSRSLEREEQVFEVTVPEALALFAQPKFRKARNAPEPLKTFGNDPVSGKPMRVMQGRFGLYVTDGETNATLRSHDAIETLGEDRAIELLQERREKEARGEVGMKRGRRGKPPAKKTAPKAAPADRPAKTAAKKAGPNGDGPKKKPPAKKPPAKKSGSAAKKPAGKLSGTSPRKPSVRP